MDGGTYKMVEEEKLTLDKDIKLFADELKECFSKEQLQKRSEKCDLNQ